MKKKLLVVLALIFGFYLVFSSAKQVFLLFKAKGRITASQEKLSQVQSEHEKLKKGLEYRNSDEFVEEEARNRLGLAKEGETIVILPQGLQAQNQNEVSKSDGRESNIIKWFERLF